jgi:hypothetical protein
MPDIPAIQQPHFSHRIEGCVGTGGDKNDLLQAVFARVDWAT